MGSKSPIAQCRETEQGVTLTIKKPSTRYLDQFIRMKCAPDLLAADIYPNGKEITESAAAYSAVHLLRDFDLGDSRVKMIAVADGSTPRTGAMFAFRSAWQCYSVDPKMCNKTSTLYKWEKIARLKTFRMKIEEFATSFANTWINSPLVIAAVHSHVSLEVICQSIFNAPRVAIIAMPCCIPLHLNDICLEYEDWGIWSPKRTMKIYQGSIKEGRYVQD